MSSTSSNQSSPLPTYSTANKVFSLRHTVLDKNAHILIALIILVPIFLVLALCLIAFSVYRYRKRKARRAAMDIPMSPIDQNQSSIATIYYNPNHNPVTLEDLPPSYDAISKPKADLIFATKYEDAK